MALTDSIPNNVDLGSDKKLLRALEKWQPNFLAWWKEMGPEGFQEDEIYLRTAVSVDPQGWAHYDYVRMPEYRWGIFLVPQEEGRKVGFGDMENESAWQEVPGELRGALRRLIVTQADTEPASVEQQRQLGKTAPSLYDLRSLFQVNVEEGRHLWAMVHLLHKYFGKDGRDEAEALLERRSGDPDKPRLLNTFNEKTEEWLSFFCFTMFTDRDGKFQLAALSESGFDPLARATKFMLTEESYHLFTGETGIERIIQRTVELMKKDPNEDARAQGGIDLPTIQKWINFWFSSSLDLFGSEVSSNAAEYFASGLKGRYREREKYTDHKALDQYYEIEMPVGTQIVKKTVPLRNAMNEILRDEYIADCERVLRRWNYVIQKAGIRYQLQLPDRKFNRKVGIYANHWFTPEGQLISQEEWQARQGDWLPTPADREYVRSLMVPCYERGKIANWIAPPRQGVNGKPFDWEYVRFHRKSTVFV
ncbi:MAG: benzoyl-CoA 2,3-epoxidase subunit BoxB [Deltaproteobacteria bacterium]|nr:benzoyl-CoA 2,3-epoxidase subunit BoxB [Deltaproteobacteria bacterium]